MRVYHLVAACALLWRHGASAAVRAAIVAAVLLPLGGCQADIFLGYGFPHNDACRAASTQPGKPVNSDCLDSLGHSQE